jgi:hypothetical protein
LALAPQEETQVSAALDFLLASADKLHNFEPVACRNLRHRPRGARQNFQIALDCHECGIQTQFFQKAANRRAALRFAAFAIHRDCNFSSQPNTYAEGARGLARN